MRATSAEPKAIPPSDRVAADVDGREPGPRGDQQVAVVIGLRALADVKGERRGRLRQRCAVVDRQSGALLTAVQVRLDGPEHRRSVLIRAGRIHQVPNGIPGERGRLPGKRAGTPDALAGRVNHEQATWHGRVLITCRLGTGEGKDLIFALSHDKRPDERHGTLDGSGGRPGRVELGR